jgi:hypothetical protein
MNSKPAVTAAILEEFLSTGSFSADVVTTASRRSRAVVAG